MPDEDEKVKKVKKKYEATIEEMEDGSLVITPNCYTGTENPPPGVERC